MTTHIAMVLDRSGSMATCRQSTIDSVNAYLEEARKDDKMKDADFDLVIFDSVSIDTIRSGPVHGVLDITEEDYEPRSMTPLFDAIGRGIEGLETKKGDRSVLVIVTDGAENSSRKHNHSSISELIKAKQAAGWLVVFLGAGLDAAKQGTSIGINSATVANIGLSSANLRSVAANTYAMSASYTRGAAAATMCFSEQARSDMGDESNGAGLAKTVVAGTVTAAKAKQRKPDAFTKPSGDAWK